MKNNNKRADTIAGIIIAVFILSFAMLGIVNVLDYNQSVSDNYEKETDLYILKSNSENILKRLDVSHVNQDEKFYIFKDTATSEYKVLTGTTNEQYKYVDKDGNLVNPTTNVGKTYSREFTKKIDILRYDIKPPEINNLVFHFDATNVDGTNNSSLSDGASVSTWVNLANNTVGDFVDKDTINTGNTIYSSNVPTLEYNGINVNPIVSFNGTDQMLGTVRHADTNNDSDGYANKVYMEKSFAIVFKTGDDITNQQVVYEQGGAGTGYNFYVESGDVWAGVLNYGCGTGDLEDNGTACPGYADSGYKLGDPKFYFTWDNFHKQKSVRLGEVRPNTIYFVMIVQDSTHLNRTARPIIEDIKDKRYIDSQNRLKIYLNGILANEVDHVDAMPEHHYAGMGNVFAWSVTPANLNREVIYDITHGQKAYFKGGIGELISRNHALTDNEIKGVQNYFSQKWLGGKSSIRYDIVETDIKEYKKY